MCSFYVLHFYVDFREIILQRNNVLVTALQFIQVKSFSFLNNHLNRFHIHLNFFINRKSKLKTFLEQDGKTALVQGCINPSVDLRAGFNLQTDQCYNLLDCAVWNSIEDKPFPKEHLASIKRIELSYCDTDMCNVNEDACEETKKARDLLKPFGKFPNFPSIHLI